MWTIIYVIILINTSLLHFSSSEGLFGKCEGRQCSNNVQVPMMDQLNAQLMANLDISQLTQQLRVYIDKEIQKSLEDKINHNFVEKIARLDNDLSYLNGIVTIQILFILINLFISSIYR